MNKAWLGVVALSSSVLAGCPGSGLDPWENYPSLHSGAGRFSRWLVIKCTYSNDRGARSLPTDLPPEITTLDEYIDYFLTLKGAETGNMVDYLHDVTYGKLQFQGKVMGWYDAPFAEGSGLSRKRRVEQCANSMSDADAATIDFSDYDGIIAVTNKIQDGGACKTGKESLSIKGSTYNLGCLTFDSGAMYTAFAAHEVGHGLGLPHSADTSLVDYTDTFDLMSALRTLRFDWANYPGEGAAAGQAGAGPGMSVPNLLTLDAIPASKIATWNVGSSQQSFRLAALSHPESPDSLALRIVGPNQTVETVEYRQRDGWDAGFTANIVLVHKFVPGGTPLSILRNGPTFPAGASNGGWVAGQLLIASDAGYSLYVDSVDPVNNSAVVTLNSL